jgi:hypothetical protein
LRRFQVNVMMKHAGHALGRWIILAAAVVCLALVIYVVGQQLLRQSANDPQIGMAEDAAAALAAGQSYEAILPAEIVSFENSLTPFLMVFDASGKPVASSAYLKGGVPAPPPGVFAYTRDHGQDRITWQPRPGVRIAAIVQHYAGQSSGFVLAGRSLREIERRENQILGLTALGALATLAVTLVVAVLVEVVAALLHQTQ